MTRLSSFDPASRRGSALVVTLLVVAALVSFLSIAGLITGQFSRFAGRQQGEDDLVAAADAGLEYLYAQWKPVANFSLGRAPVSSNFPKTSILLASLNGLSAVNAKGVTFTAPSIYLADSRGVPDTTSTLAVGTPTSNVPNYPGWSGTTYNYVASVTVTANNSNLHYGFFSDSKPSMTVKRYFQVTQVPFFQAAIFYENKLEIHPGADMRLTGLVHSNADVWARGFSTLEFLNNVSYVTSFNQIGDSSVSKGWDGYGYGWIPGVTPGLTTVPMPTWSDGKTSANSSTYATQVSQVSPINPFGTTPTDNNGLHDLIDPPSGNTSKQIAYNNASIIITVNSSLPLTNANSVVITDGSGNALSAADTTAVKAAIDGGTTTTIWDQREASNVTITTLDMAKLAAATVATTATPTALQTSFANSALVYIHDVSTATGSEKGIRLVNGRNLGQNVSVATNNSLYILGDYNTGGNSASDVPSNASNAAATASPEAATYSRYASAVMADAVTILSNNWQDSNSNGALNARMATATTVNTAILAGDIPSNYNGNLTASGGAHNFPRFLENWNNVNFTYYGSLVEAFRSESGTGLWQTGNVYYWPNRNWNFDTNFLTQQPPGYPNGVQLSRGRWQRNNS